MNGAGGRDAAQRCRQMRKSQQQQCRGQGEAAPCGQSAPPARAGKADGKTDLAAGGTGKELPQRYQVSKTALIQPAPPDHEGLAEISDMGNGPAEGGDPQRGKGAKHFP